MNHIEDIFGNDPIELVIRWHPKTVASFNKNSSITTFEKLKEAINEKEFDCYFQNLGEKKHKVFIPIQSLGYQAELILVWHETTFSYKGIVKGKNKTFVKNHIKLPDEDYISEKCTIHLINIDQPYRTKDELEHLFNQVDKLDVPADVDVDKENEIWFKYIDATKKIIEKRQEPFEVRRYYPVKPIGGSPENATRFNFRVDLKIEESREYKQLENKLKELDVENPRFDEEGNIFLTLEDIYRALDPILKSDFEGIIVRDKWIGCIIKIRPNSVLNQVRNDFKKFGWNLKIYGDFKKKEIYFSNVKGSSRQIRLPREVIDKYDLQRIGLYARFKLIDEKGFETFRDIEEKVDPKLYGAWLENRKQRFFERVVRQRKRFYDRGFSSVSKPDICEAYTHSSEKEEEFSESFWKDLKRDLYALPFNIDYNEYSETIYFEFKTHEELEGRIEKIRDLGTFDLSYLPDGFKYKVKTNIISRKTHLETIGNRIEKLGGVDFDIIIPKQNDETGEWFFPEEKRPKKLLIGTLSRRESNIGRLIFTLNTFYKEHKKALSKLLELTDERVPIKAVYPNLIGDAVKISWLRNAVSKLTNPNDKPNGKPVNTKLRDFIFDSSKAEAIYDESKISEGSTYWLEIENSKLSQNLNPSQIRAVLSALHSTDLCLLQGPPGTGKTTVISEMIWQQIRKNAEKPDGYRILLTSETNLAVDNALEKLVGSQTTIVKPLRFGKSIKFEEEGKKYSVDRIMKWVDENYEDESDYENEQLETDEEESEELGIEDVSNNAVQRWMLNIGNRAQQRATSKYSEVLKDWHKDLAQPTKEIKTLFKDKYFKYVNVIGSTCSSCGSPRFKRDYDTIFNQNFNGRAASEVVYLMENYPESRKIWRLLEEDLAFDTDYMSESEFPEIKQALSEKLNISFDTVIMDEASKATPPEMVLPLCFGKKSIIIGDHKQLPPMINDREFREVLREEAEDEKLANEIGNNYLKESQFKRLISNPKVSPTIRATFDVQYRMHSQIGTLIQQFYPELDQGLICGIQEHEDIEDLDHPASRYHGFYHEGFIKPHTHVMWIDVPEPEEKEGTSRINESECETVKQVLNYLKHSEGFDDFQSHWESIKDDDKRLQEQEVGIISFYGKQVRKLNEVRKYAQKELGIPIRLKTVDKFQGMERNIIIVSTVRSDSIIDPATGGSIPNIRGREGRGYSPWGFADSPERLNVALSRARRLLIVVGNRRHFANFKNQQGVAIYENVINQIRSENIIDYRKLNRYK